MRKNLNYRNKKYVFILSHTVLCNSSRGFFSPWGKNSTRPGSSRKYKKLVKNPYFLIEMAEHIVNKFVFVVSQDSCRNVVETWYNLKFLFTPVFVEFSP